MEKQNEITEFKAFPVIYCTVYSICTLDLGVSCFAEVVACTQAVHAFSRHELKLIWHQKTSEPNMMDSVKL
jgi:hypothetical protein